MPCSSPSALNLRRGAVDQHHPDVQRPQHRHVQEDVGEVLVRDDGPVDGDDEGLFAKRGMYWRMPRRSVGFTMSCAPAAAQLPSSSHGRRARCSLGGR